MLETCVLWLDFWGVTTVDITAAFPRCEKFIVSFSPLQAVIPIAELKLSSIPHGGVSPGHVQLSWSVQEHLFGTADALQLP